MKKKLLIYGLPLVILAGILSFVAYRFWTTDKPKGPTVPETTGLQQIVPYPWNGAGNFGDDDDDGKDTSQTETDKNPVAAPPPPPIDLATLSDSPLWKQLLSTPDGAALFIRMLDDISLGERPLKTLGQFRPQGYVTAEHSEDGRLVLSEESCNRFNPLIDVFCSIPADQAATAFVQNEPMLQEACNALGYKDKQVRELLAEAIAMLLAAPDIDFQPTIEPGGAEGIFYWNDPVIEKLTDVQKLYLRTGPENCRRIRRQLQDIAEALHLFATEESTNNMGTPDESVEPSMSSELPAIPMEDD